MQIQGNYNESGFLLQGLGLLIAAGSAIIFLKVNGVVGKVFSSLGGAIGVSLLVGGTILGFLKPCKQDAKIEQIAKRIN